MSDDFRVEVQGLRDLRKALKEVGDDTPKELRDGLFELAGLVAGETRARVPVRSGHARDSVKARRQSAAAAIAVGGNKAPYYGWLEFGGTVGKGRVAAGVAKKRAGGTFGGTAGSVKRPWIAGGRYLYPALRDKRQVINDRLDALLAGLAKKAGFETTGDANG